MWQSISQIRNSNHHYDKSNRVIFEYKNHKNHKESKVRELCESRIHPNQNIFLFSDKKKFAVVMNRCIVAPFRHKTPFHIFKS